MVNKKPHMSESALFLMCLTDVPSSSFEYTQIYEDQIDCLRPMEKKKSIKFTSMTRSHIVM